MNKTIAESRVLVEQLKLTLSFPLNRVEVVVCPPFPSLEAVGRLLEGSPIRLGAQNMYDRDDGAYTGEVSASMLVAAGCRYVILGHSERRQYFQETDEFINRKVKKALAAGLVPIVCVGETLEEREQGVTERVITKQVGGVLKDLNPEAVRRCIVAYEPVWAIGTGKTATPSEAEDVHRHIRTLVTGLVGAQTAERLVIQYGGSVKPENAGELLSQADIDGALVGGACLKAESFAQIVRAAADLATS
jgi:triosephosphate isomerase